MADEASDVHSRRPVLRGQGVRDPPQGEEAGGPLGGPAHRPGHASWTQRTQGIVRGVSRGQSLNLIRDRD